MSGTSPTSTSVGQNALQRRPRDPAQRQSGQGEEQQPATPVRRAPRTPRSQSAATLPAVSETPSAPDQAATGDRPSAAERLRAAAQRARDRKAGPAGAEDARRPAAALTRTTTTDLAEPAAAPPAEPTDMAMTAETDAAQTAQTAPQSRALAVRTPRFELPPLPKITLPTFRMPRLRLLPGVVFCLFIMLGDRSAEVFVALTSDTPVQGFGETLRLDEALAEDTDAIDAAAGTPIGPDTEMATASVDPMAGDTMTDDAMTGDIADGAEPATGPLETAAVASADDPSLPLALATAAGVNDSELAVLQDLSERRETLDAREQAIIEQEALLQVAEQRIDEKIAELHLLRDELEGLLTSLSAQQDAQMESLVRIYETMRPGDAAAIFDGLDMVVLLDVLQLMSERRSAPILAAMNPERARQVTAELALRRELPELPE